MRIFVGNPGPIEGAEVFLDGVSVGLTGADGFLAIAEVTVGSHTIRAHKDGYEDASATISVPETTEVTLTLTVIKIGTELRLSSDKTSYEVGETARLTQGLYDPAGNLISGRVVDYTVMTDGVWHAGWRQNSDDPSRDLVLPKAGTYYIAGVFAGDAVYKPSSATLVLTAEVPLKYTLTTSVKPPEKGGVWVYYNGKWHSYYPIIDPPERGVHEIDAGTEVPIEAGVLTESGYRFDHWSGDASGTDAAITITMDSDKSVTANFAQELYTITVSVQGSGPIAGASVYFDGGYVGLTNPAGGITITDVTAGSHTIEARKSGYESDSATISVPETTSVTLTLTPVAIPTYTVSVHVEESIFGVFLPIIGASVYFDYSYFDWTDSAGNVSIGEVTEGWHNIWAEKVGYHQAGADIYVPRTTSITLRLTPIAPPPGEIRVKVSMWVVGHLYPLSGAPIYLDGVFAGKADTDGLLTITGVSEGTHKVKVAPAALTPITKSVTVPDGYAAFVFYLP